MFVFGKISKILFLGGFNVCFDFYIYLDYEVLFFYDLMLGKLIVFVFIRKEVMCKMCIVLE